MFNKSNFCHIASNNRNEQKGSVFIYKTADTLAQVTQSGYFNEKLIDINVHDLIIHVQYNPVDRTLKKSVLIVTERTLDNVETAPILDQTIGDDIADLGDQVQGIEEKIPGAASAANQLADKAFVNDIKTAIETTIAGINTSISTLNNDLSQTNQNLSQTNQYLAQTNQNVDSLQETKQDKATAVNYDNITNCITEIPQDIKLELADGVLTLKAGSKLYIPNSVDVFDVFNVSSDYVSSSTGANETMVCCYIQNTDSIGFSPLSNCTSGANATTTTGYAYDTTTNKIRFINSSGAVQHDTCSFPIAIVKTDNNGLVASIDQVFNGFGYIGSTVFVLPGVKGLIPNGRNTDGTLNNTEWVCSSVVIRTFPSSDNHDTIFGFNGNQISRDYIENVKYDEKLNLVLDANNNWRVTIIGFGKLTSGVISDFNIKTVFHAVDYSDTEYIAHQAMPSDKYTDLTLGASGTTYTAPADGYFVLAKTSSASWQTLTFVLNGTEIDNFYSFDKTIRGILCTPVAKGDSLKINYTLGGITDMFRFIYANGAK